MVILLVPWRSEHTTTTTTMTVAAAALVVPVAVPARSLEQGEKAKKCPFHSLGHPQEEEEEKKKKSPSAVHSHSEATCPHDARRCSRDRQKEEEEEEEVTKWYNDKDYRNVVEDPVAHDMLLGPFLPVSPVPPSNTPSDVSMYTGECAVINPHVGAIPKRNTIHPRSVRYQTSEQ